jgi:hypothetical protein
MWLCAPTLAHLFALQTIDASIHRAYIHLIRGAKRYLYLENQVRPLLYCAVLSTAGCWQAAGRLLTGWHAYDGDSGNGVHPRAAVAARNLH